MAGDNDEEVSYYEDTQEKKTVASDDGAGAKTPSASQDKDKGKGKAATPAKASAVGEKRQRTLEGMFGGAVTKKPKLERPAAAAGSKRAPGTTLNSIPFSMSEFEASLSDEEKELLSLECATIGKSWLKILKDEIRKPYFLALKRFLASEGVTPDDSNPKCKVYPPAKCIYNWSNTPLGRVKCVIVGQDPYHGPGQAHGLSFSVRDGVAIPPSLRNMYAEIKAEYPDFVVPKHGNLTPWAEEQGVLLLNAALTVRAGEAASHSNRGWETFTHAVLAAVDTYGGANLAKDGTTGVVFLAWGAHAAKRVATLSKSKHLILQSAHPSPLSAHRGFLGNGHFRKANEWLERKYGEAGVVDWCKL